MRLQAEMPSLYMKTTWGTKPACSERMNVLGGSINLIPNVQ
ncbi:hypothetical protein LEMLEM_LOCUS10186 [Lemmus lemmus]